MDLAQGESLVEQFLERAWAELPERPASWRWVAHRPIDDEDLSALDGLMRRLLELDDVDVCRLTRRLGIKVPEWRHPSTRRVQHRWALFEHLKARVIALRAERGTDRQGEVGIVFRQGTEEAGQAAAGAERAVGVGQDL